MFKFALVVVFLVSVTQFVLARSNKIDRVALGVANIQEEPECQSMAPPNLWGMYNGELNINRDLVANDFDFYMAIAHDAYKDCDDAAECMKSAYYRYDRLKTPWKIVKVSPLATSNGFRAMVFENSSDKIVRIIVAFRGTDGLNFPDYWYGNFSWLTQWILPNNQYAAARSFMRDAVLETTARAGESGKKVCFTAVGHSLGGGLAQHVAYGFPNTAAVVLDSSPVLNHFRFKEPFDLARIFHVHERGDMLSSAYESVVGRYTPNNIHYPMNLIELDCQKLEGFRSGLCRVQYFVYKNHDTLAVSEGMSRMTMDCRLTLKKDCEIELKRPVSVATLELGCSARTNGSRLDLCDRYEKEFGAIPKGG